MRRRVLLVLLVVAGLVPGLAARAAQPPDEPISGGAVPEACVSTAGAVPEIGSRACRTGYSVVWGTGAACWRNDVPREACIRVDGRDLSEQAMVDYEASWTHRALGLQRELDADVSLLRSLIPHTHNSFNAAAYMPTLSGSDPNQAVSMRDQLRLDIRSIEIDVHWFPSATSGGADGGMAPIMCHGRTEGGELRVHVGCTVERHLRDGLAEVREWLQAQPATDPQLVLLYLENQLNGDPAAHNAATAAIEAQLGSFVLRPPAGGGCTPMPFAATRNQLLAGRSRVLIVGNCDPNGGAWNTWVHDRGQPTWDESGSDSDHVCQPQRYGKEFVRRYEDSTWLSAMAGMGSELTAEETGVLVRCGVNMPGFDQLRAKDARLRELVWSWAPDEPAASGDCAAQNANARFVTSTCSTHLPYACVDGAGTWRVTPRRGPWAAGDAACRRAFPGSSFGVPPNGMENARLRAAAPAGNVWLDYAKVKGDWRVG
jgi:hypothetical protein